MGELSIWKQSLTPQRRWVLPEEEWSSGCGGDEADSVLWQQGELAAMEEEVAWVQAGATRLGQLHPAAQEGLAKQLAGVQEAWATLNAEVREQDRQLEKAARGRLPRTLSGDCCRWHPVVGSALPCRVGVTHPAHAFMPCPQSQSAPWP